MNLGDKIPGLGEVISHWPGGVTVRLGQDGAIGRIRTDGSPLLAALVAGTPPAKNQDMTNKENKTMKFQAIIRKNMGRPSDIEVGRFEVNASGYREARDIAAKTMESSPATRHLSVGQNCELRYQPQVGDGAHFGGNGDAYPVTVLKVSATGHTVTVQSASYKIAKSDQGHKEGHRVATFTENLGGAIMTYTRRRNGRYILKGSTGSWSPLSAGYATAYNPHY